MEDKDFEKWERQVEETTAKNQELLDAFQAHLESKSLKPKTVKSHVDNIAFFANDYLLRDEITPVEKGASEIGWFLGDFFIRKTTWASKSSIKENIASFKKFYTFLNEQGKVSNEELNEMKTIIKEEKDIWLDEVDSYWDDMDF